MSRKIHLRANPSLLTFVEHLPASKSISNRVLILNALSGGNSQLHNLSGANDTRLMRDLIASESPLIDVEDAGTTMRFLTAYFAITGQRKTLTGTARMLERPIGILVDALRTLGATINYKKTEGYPPLEIQGFSGQKADRLSIRGDVSSQFISAVMMVAPLLPQGLSIELAGKVGSRPYIEMTATLMERFGVRCSFSGNVIRIDHQQYRASELSVESDWSAASYWFAFAALAKEADIRLPQLFVNSLQGDHAVRHIMESLGVRSAMEDGILRLTKKDSTDNFTWDFSNSPDLAQTVAVVCAAKGVSGHFTGLESLRIKETDRIAALQKELRKMGADLKEHGNGWSVIPSASLPEHAEFETYGDHRMAMAFAPLATIMDVSIIDPIVVRKSYPKFWLDVEVAGFEVAQS